MQIVRAAWERSRSVCVGSVGISASAENGVGAGVGTRAAGGVRGGAGVYAGLQHGPG